MALVQHDARVRWFDERTAKQPDGCWLWLGYVTPKGYAEIHAGLVHRLVVGALPGQVVHHVCGQRSCVNPDHLQLLDSVQEHQAEHTGETCRRGHVWTPETTHITVTGRRRCRVCCAQLARGYRVAT